MNNFGLPPPFSPNTQDLLLLLSMVCAPILQPCHLCFLRSEASTESIRWLNLAVLLEMNRMEIVLSVVFRMTQLQKVGQGGLKPFSVVAFSNVGPFEMD